MIKYIRKGEYMKKLVQKIFMIIKLNIAKIRKRKVKYIPYGKRKGDRNEH